MTLEDRRQQLVAEVSILMDTVVSPDLFSQRDAAGNAPEDSFLAELERQLKEKTAELEAINARMNRFSYRFRMTSRSLLWLLWLSAAALLLFTFTIAAFLGSGYQIFFGLLALVSAAWAVWASIPPSE